MNLPYYIFNNDELIQLAHDIVYDRDGEPMNEWSRDRLRGVYREMRRRNRATRSSDTLPFPDLMELL